MPAAHTANHPTKSRFAFFFLCLTALGVVFGDIGTSPLYAINEIFFGHNPLSLTSDSVLGSISLVIWTITLVVCLKYVILVLRADNDGEGGVFALYSLLNQIKAKSVGYLGPLLIISAGLLLGDGMITPAISVISAVEGIKVLTASFSAYVVPATLVILTLLFLLQQKGTAKVGTIFGPIITLWFITIGLLGLWQVMQTPQVLVALNPLYAVRFFFSHDLHTLLIVLGSVMLTITGGEAMYADMGHFGRKPIRYSWFSLVYPCLLLNYLGQAAFVLGNNTITGDNIFYSMVPRLLLVPMVILATFASVIASQAMISGAFSLITQAVRLGFFPMLKVVHTHNEHEGQIYVPFINLMLYLGSISLVLIFQSSTSLAATYGLAVSGDMLVTSLTMVAISQYLWGWKVSKIMVTFLPFVVIDAVFLTANSLKLFEGGFIPVSIALLVLTFIQTWRWGRGKIEKTFREYPAITIKELIEIKKTAAAYLPRSIVLMAPDPILSENDSIPVLEQIFWERYGMLPKHLIFLTVVTKKVPRIATKRYEVTTFFDDKEKGSIVAVKVNFGFMENPLVEPTLVGIAAKKEIHIDEHPRDWLVHVVHEKILKERHPNLFRQIRYNLFRLLQRNSHTADQHFGLGNKQRLSIEILPVRME